MMDQLNNRSSFTLRVPYWIVVPALLALLEFIAFVGDGYQVSGDTISDSDTLMRLSYLRHVWATGSWEHGFFARSNAPYGMVLHWTLPFNLLLLLSAKALFFLGHDAALQTVGYWCGPFFCLAVAAAAYWAARRIASPIASAFTAGLSVFSPFQFNYADAGVANHHALLYLNTVIMAGFAFAAIKRPENKWMAIGGGALAGFCLWCSFELVIVAGAYFALLFYLWAGQDKAGIEARWRSLLLSSASFAATTGFALLTDPPYGGLGTIVFDHISLAFVALASMPLILALPIFAFSEAPTLKRFEYLGLAGLLVGGLYLIAFPTALGGVEGAMDPYVKKEWLASINEVRPIQGWRDIALYLGTGALSLLMIPLIVRRNFYRVALLVFLAGLGVMAETHYRFCGYLIIASAFLLGAAFDRSRRSSRRWARIAGVTMAIVLFGGFYLAEIASNVFDIDLESGAGGDGGYNCNPYYVKDLLNDSTWLTGASDAPIVADDINMTPMLLYWTGVRTLAGNYHRDSQGIKDSYLFFRDMGDKTAHEIARRRGIDYVMVCADGANLGYSFTSQAKALAEKNKPDADYKPEETLYTRLSDSDPPDWLEPVPWPEDTDSDLLLYRVVR